MEELKDTVWIINFCEQQMRSVFIKVDSAGLCHEENFISYLLMS